MARSVRTSSLPWLPEKEAKVYQLLLVQPRMLASDIQKKSRLTTGTTYNTLEQLKKKGLIEDVKGTKKKTVQACHPSALLEFAERKEREAVRNRTTVESSLSMLESLYRLGRNKPAVRFYEGKEGIQRIYGETLACPEMMHAFVATGNIDPELDAWIDTVYVKRRVRKKIFARTIAPDTRANRQYAKKDRASLRETKLLPKKEMPLNAGIVLYGTHHVAILSLQRGHLLGVIIDSRQLYESLFAIFTFCWNRMD
ncbi:MAG: helix-turn-helix domain-containing protein [Patescibacteria group bacterium]